MAGLQEGEGLGGPQNRIDKRGDRVERGHSPLL